MVTGSWMSDKLKTRQTDRGKPIAWCRKLVNQRIGRIRRMFRWAASEELVVVSVYTGQRSRSAWGA